MIKPIKNNPAPNYKVEGDMIRRTKSASIKKPKVDLNAKRGTFIDQIELYEKKNKTPGVGKLDLTKYSSIKKAKSSPAKDMRESNRIRNNNFDDDIRRAVEVPGPGDFNPHVRMMKYRSALESLIKIGRPTKIGRQSISSKQKNWKDQSQPN